MRSRCCVARTEDELIRGGMVSDAADRHFLARQKQGGTTSGIDQFCKPVSHVNFFLKGSTLS